MSLTHSSDMGIVTRIEFAEALLRLQDLIDAEVRVLVNFHGTFGSCLIEGRLTLVQTLPPDDEAITLLIDDRQAVLLDPIDTEVLLVGEGTGEESLDFHLLSGVVIRLESL